MSTQETIRDIQSHDKGRRNRALRYLYKTCFPHVRRFVLNNSGDIEEAEDVFQDAIATAYMNLVENKFRGESSLKVYINAISRNIWLMKLRKKQVPVHTLTEATIPDQQEEEHQVNAGVIQSVMKHLDEGCRNLLISFYFESHTMLEIAASFGLGSAQAAKTKKLRCMKRLSKIVREQGLQQNHFIV